MPPYLEPFKERVEEQARLYPGLFFLSALHGEKKIGLTFDDGPSTWTPLILDILQEYQIQATFFLLGERAQPYSHIIEEILKDGHLIGNHSFSHQDLRELSPQEVFEKEIHPTSLLLEEMTGLYPLILRPPYGAISDEAIEYLGQKGFRIVNWSLDTFDWDRDQNSIQEIWQKVESYHHPGAIILLHDGGGNRENTLKALPLLIETLQKRGYLFQRLDELLAIDPYFLPDL